jgi:hypothetical protein
MLIALYREALINVVQGRDAPLSATHTRKQLIAMGFVQIKTNDGKVWCHNDGDAVGDRILLADITWDSARAEQAGRVTQSRTLLGREGFTQRSSR